jgi:hypothetical protein
MLMIHYKHQPAQNANRQKYTQYNWKQYVELTTCIGTYWERYNYDPTYKEDIEIF